MNIIKMLGIKYKKDIINNLIIGLINESTSFKNQFLENILKIDDCKSFEVRAYEGMSSPFVSDIKIDIKSKEVISKYICISYTEEDFIGEYVINLTYKDLINNVNADIEDDVLNKLYKDLCDVINEFYEGLDIKEDDKVNDILVEDTNIEKSFIRFKKIIKDIQNDDFNVDNIDKISLENTTDFIVNIKRDEWSKNKVRLLGDTYRLTEDDYKIYINSLFDVLNKSMTLSLYYEINSDVDMSELIPKTRHDDYILYALRREEFKNLVHDELRELKDLDIELYHEPEKIASIKINIDNNLEVKDFKRIIKDNINILSNVIDNMQSNKKLANC